MEVTFCQSLLKKLIFCNQSVCRGKSEYWCLGANNPIVLFPQPLPSPPPKHTVLFEDYVACDMQNCKHYTAIAMEVSCKYNADLPDKMVSLSFLWAADKYWRICFVVYIVKNWGKLMVFHWYLD